MQSGNSFAWWTGSTRLTCHRPAFNTAERYDPVSNTFTALTTTMKSARALHTATLLANGKVLWAGGGYDPMSSAFTIVNTPDVYDPVANTCTALAVTLTVLRALHAAPLLSNG